MSILNSEELDRRIARAVEVVSPVEKEFEKFFNDGDIPVLLIDHLDEIDVLKVAEDNDALYIDLSRQIDYAWLCRIVQDVASIIFDNIDKIPESECKEEIQYLVKYALRKEDDVPTPYGSIITFAGSKIGARCSQEPDYLYQGSKACPLRCIVPQE